MEKKLNHLKKYGSKTSKAYRDFVAMRSNHDSSATHAKGNLPISLKLSDNRRDDQSICCPVCEGSIKLDSEQAEELLSYIPESKKQKWARLFLVYCRGDNLAKYWVKGAIENLNIEKTESILQHWD